MTFATRLGHLDEIVTLRRSLHMQAELPGEEHTTAKILENFFRIYPPQQLMNYLGGYGLAAIFDSGQPGPSVLIRADMDALPIHELNDIVYRSTRDGVSHKCGHDGHMAIVAGLAPLLIQNPPQRGRAILLYQPSEETGQGAAQIIQDPRFEKIQPDYCFALHNLPGFPMGQVVVTDDVFAAASVGLIVEFKGATSHAAYPEEGKSPARAMAKMIEGLEKLNHDFDSQGHFSLVTVVSASLGEHSFGISPGAANVMATLRSYDEETLARLQERAAEMARSLAQQDGLQVNVIWNEYFPVTRNHPEAAERIRAAAQRHQHEVSAPPEPFRWSEDFGWFTRQAEGAMFGLGAGEDLVLHSATYDFPESLLKPGIQIFMGILESLLYDPVEGA